MTMDGEVNCVTVAKRHRADSEKVRIDIVNNTERMTEVGSY